MKPAGAAVRCAGFELDEVDSLPAWVEDPVPEASLLASEAWLLAGPVVVTLVTKVEPLVVIDDATTPVVTEPDTLPETPVPEAETPEAEKAVLVTVEAMALPLWVTVVSKVAVEIGMDPLPVASMV